MWFEGNRSGTAGRARLSQAGGAGTKAERGHSCPQQCRTEVKLSDVPILLGIRELLRTRMSALRWRPKNLRALRRLSHIVIQRGRAATETARATAEYAEYAEAGREKASVPRVSRILRFNRCGGRAPVQIFAVREEVGLLQFSAP